VFFSMPLVLFSFERSEIDEVEGAVKSAAIMGATRELDRSCWW